MWSTTVKDQLIRDLVNLDDYDVELKCNDGSIQAHSHILKARSPVFKVMFSNSAFIECNEKKVIMDHDMAVIKTFYKFLLSGEIIMSSADIRDLYELMLVADKYARIDLYNGLRTRIISLVSSFHHAIMVLTCCIQGSDIENIALESVCTTIYARETNNTHQKIALDDIDDSVKVRIFCYLMRKGKLCEN